MNMCKINDKYGIYLIYSTKYNMYYMDPTVTTINPRQFPQN